MSDMIAIIPVKGTIAAANLSEIRDEIKKIGAVWQGGAKIEGGYERPEMAFWAVEEAKEGLLRELLFQKLKYHKNSFELRKISNGIGPKVKKAGKFAKLLDLADRRIADLKAEHEAKIEALEALDEGDREERKGELEAEFAEELGELEKERDRCEEAMVKAGLGKKKKAELEQEVLEQISKKICFVGDNYSIASKTNLPEKTPHLRIPYRCESVEMLKMDSFKRLWEGYKAVLGKNPAETWMTDLQHKKTAKRFVFEKSLPLGVFEKDGENLYNVWSGFSVSPKKGNCSMFKEFWLDRICNKRKNYFDFFWKLVSFWVQNPDQRSVAPMIIGKNRIGKNFFIDTIGDIFGNSFAGLGKSADIVGKFNTILLGKVLIHAEEAHFLGEAKHWLKTMVTGTKIKIEGKGTNSTFMENNLKYIFSSNENIPVEMGMLEQRYFVLMMNENLKPNPPFFRALADHLREGGLQALLYELLETDLTGFDPINLESGISDNLHIKLESLDTVERFLKESIENGTFWWTNNTAGWGTEIRRDVLLEQVCHWAKIVGEPIPKEFYAKFEKACGDCIKISRKAFATESGSVRKRTYVLEPIEKFEEHFSEKLGEGEKNIF